MKLYIEADRKDEYGNEYADIDPELEEIYWSLLNIIKDNFIDDINSELDADLFISSKAYPKDRNSAEVYETPFKSIEKYLTSRYLPVYVNTDVVLSTNFKISNGYSKDYVYIFNHSHQEDDIDFCMLVYFEDNNLYAEIRWFPLNKEFNSSKYVLEPDFVKNTYSKLLNETIKLCSKDIDIENRKTKFSLKKAVKIPAKEWDSLEDWYFDSDDSEDIQSDFADIMIAKLEKEYPDAEDIYGEPSVQGLDGGDFWNVIMSDGSSLGTSFDFREEMQYMFDHGAKACANHYFNRFNKEAEFEEE